MKNKEEKQTWDCLVSENSMRWPCCNRIEDNAHCHHADEGQRYVNFSGNQRLRKAEVIL